MPTRFRLPASGSPSVTPAFQSYTHASGTRRPMPTADSSALTTTAVAPDAADHLVAGDVSVFQGVSDPLAAQTIAAQVVTLNIQGLEVDLNNNLFVQLWIGVVSNDGTTALATLLAKTADTLELIASLQSRTMTPTTTAYTIAAGNEGARIVVELSLVGTPTATGGTQGHNGSLRFGSNGVGGDLLANDTQTGTTLNPFCEFANVLAFISTGIATPTLGALTDTLVGTVLVAGTSSRTLAVLTVTSAGSIGAGTLAQTLAALTTVATGTVQGVAHGTLTKTLGSVSLLATGTAFMPSYPRRRRFAFGWPQPIGPTHVRIF